MKIYINDIEVQSLVLNSISSTLDETLDTFSFALINSTETPYAPMQEVKIVDENNETEVFVISVDSVEPLSLHNEEKFKHSITCTEGTRALSKHLVRNSVFAQPYTIEKRGIFFYCALEYFLNMDTSEYHYEYKEIGYDSGYRQCIPEPLTLDNKEKIRAPKLILRTQIGLANANQYDQDIYCTTYTDLKSSSEMNDLVTATSSNITIHIQSVILHYTLNGNDETETISASDLGYIYLPLNTEIQFPRISELREQGANDFYIEIQNAVSGIMYPQTGTHIPAVLIQAEVLCETYYYTCYDILNLLYLRGRKAHGGIEEEMPFALPSSGELYELLNRTIAPNFTFTQATLYDCVAEVFRVFDGIFTIDENKVLGITYFNERSNPTITPACVGKTKAIAEDRYVNGYVSYYQGARQRTSFPEGNSYAPTRTREIGIPQEGDHSFVVPYAIHAVNRAYIKTEIVVCGEITLTQLSRIHLQDYPLEITHYIVEKSLWSGYLDETTDVNYGQPANLYQNNTIVFSKGDNAIDLAYTYQNAWGTTYYAFGNMLNCAVIRLAGLHRDSNPQAVFTYVSIVSPNSSSPAWNTVFMRVDYIAEIDGRLQIESAKNKYQGQMIIDQSSGAVDLGKLGLNMLGLSYKMGEPSLSFAHKTSTWANRIKRGDILVIDNENWIANSCSYTDLGNGYYQGRVAFVKDFNELSLRKQVLRDKRLSNVSNELTIKSEDNIVEYCYFSTNQDDMTGITFGGSFNMYSLYGALAYSFGSSFGSMKSVDYGYIKTSEGTFYLPCVKYGAGNSINFEFSYDSSMTAGITTRTSQTGWWGSTAYVSSYVLYSDNGFIDTCEVGLARDDSSSFDENFPVIAEPSSKALLLTDYEVYKQQNEVFALNYEMCFLAVNPNTDFIGSRLIEDNFFTNPAVKDRKLRYYYGSEPYSILDLYGKGNYARITSISVTAPSDYLRIDFVHPAQSGLDYWAICDEEGRILFASNRQLNPQGGTTTATIYFKEASKRI